MAEHIQILARHLAKSPAGVFVEKWHENDSKLGNGFSKDSDEDRRIMLFIYYYN